MQIKSELKLIWAAKTVCKIVKFNLFYHFKPKRVFKNFLWLKYMLYEAIFCKICQEIFIFFGHFQCIDIFKTSGSETVCLLSMYAILHAERYIYFTIFSFSKYKHFQNYMFLFFVFGVKCISIFAAIMSEYS